MDKTIAALAARLAGLEETDTALLEPLCAAARQRWIDRLRQGVTEEACGESLTCAAAFSAAAEAVSGAGGAGGVTSFKAGEVSVQGRTAAESAALAAALRAAAEELMAPYACTGSFAFLGVKG